jgi:hypothetical protein
MFLKPDTVGIIPRGGTELEAARLLKLFKWLAYIGQTRGDVIHARNWSYICLV